MTQEGRLTFGEEIKVYNVLPDGSEPFIGYAIAVTDSNECWTFKEYWYLDTNYERPPEDDADIKLVGTGSQKTVAQVKQDAETYFQSEGKYLEIECRCEAVTVSHNYDFFSSTASSEDAEASGEKTLEGQVMQVDDGVVEIRQDGGVLGTAYAISSGSVRKEHWSLYDGYKPVTDGTDAIIAPPNKYLSMAAETETSQQAVDASDPSQSADTSGEEVMASCNSEEMVLEYLEAKETVVTIS